MDDEPRKAKNSWLADYRFLNDRGPRRAGTVRWDDVLLTTLIFLGAATDLAQGALQLGPTEWALVNLNGLNSTLINDELLRATRVRGASGIESGVAAILIGLYRVARWGKSQSFNGVVFQVTFFIGTVGRSLQLALEIPGFATPMPPSFYILVTRLAIVGFAFVLSIYTYRESWTWLWR